MFNGFFIATSGSSTSSDRATAQELAEVNYITEAPPVDPGTDPVYTPTYYVDSVNGNDSRDGTSESTAWRSLSKVSSVSFPPGTVIAFKRGQTFSGVLTIPSSGAIGNEIIYTAYGTGARPILDSNEDFTASWSSSGTNMWSTPSFRTRRLWKDGIELKSTSPYNLGHNMDEIGSAADEAVWTWNPNSLTHYSTTNPSPSTFRRQHTMNTIGLTGKVYNKFSGLDVRGGVHTFEIFSNSNHTTIEYCNVGQDSESGIYIKDNEYLTVERCSVNSQWTNFHSPDGGSSYRGVNEGISVANTHFWHADIKYCDFKNWGHAGVAISIADAQYNRVSYCFFTNPDIAYGRGVGFSGNNMKNNEIDHNYFKYNSVRSQVNGQDNHIHHNMITDSTRSVWKNDELGQGLALEGYAGSHVTGNILEYNTVRSHQSPGFDFIGDGNSTPNVENNIVRKNIFDHCGIDPYYYNSINMGMKIQYYPNIGAQTITDNAFINGSSTPIRFRNTNYSPANFNTQNGVGGYTINGNTSVVTDQGCGDISYNNTGIRA